MLKRSFKQNFLTLALCPSSLPISWLLKALAAKQENGGYIFFYRETDWSKRFFWWAPNKTARFMPDNSKVKLTNPYAYM